MGISVLLPKFTKNLRALEKPEIPYKSGFFGFWYYYITQAISLTPKFTVQVKKNAFKRSFSSQREMRIENRVKRNTANRREPRKVVQALGLLVPVS